MKRWMLAAAAATVLAGCATTTSPTGRKQYMAYSDSQLNQMGAQAFTEMKTQQKTAASGQQDGYVQCVVKALVRQLPADWQKLPWETAVFVDDSPNAFALPGGKVGVNTGMFKVAKNQDQLAAVIGHEIGHVYARHTNERVSRQAATSTGLAVVGALAGARYGQGASDMVAQGGGMAAQLGLLLPFSRVQETESDQIGQQLMAQAGFDPAQAVDLWQNMVAASAGRTPEWLSTHPDPQNRIQALRQRAPALQPAYQAARQGGQAPRCGP
ncbi:peptidase [Pseudoxanthomonas broegbernensis]|uniref:Peptidase n=1 Tax=Pseudoxanthomonas broegbernensis TaxID=83619 RepID=A0A7V8GN38_9GAMM|nr:M48 family metallopeptidase [Pseudoxanthomonas broegbernensis]KAF1686830.1 peptidase [Pseudoxanthomonas broegbernensis]MBB6065585.1 putative Zn-dependent protease [Pseudoxanthomonas broegbernensis]